MSILRSNLVSPSLENVVMMLRAHGFSTVTQVLSQDVEDIMKCLGQPLSKNVNDSTSAQEHENGNIPKEKCIKLKDINNLRKELLTKFSGCVENGLQNYHAHSMSCFTLSTGCKRLDEVLNGGLSSGQVTEICGGIASGKTQFCMRCACSAIKSRFNVYYIDTSCSFSSTRIMELLGDHCKNKEILLSNIQHKVCVDVFEVFEVIEGIIDTLSDQKNESWKCQVLIIDCIASVIYPILGGNQIDGYGLLVKLGQKLKYIAVQFNTVVLISNNIVYSDGSRGIPSLGRAWSHVPHNRLRIESSQNSHDQQRKITLIKSCHKAVPEECLYDISQGIG